MGIEEEGREKWEVKKRQVVGTVSWKPTEYRWKHSSHHNNAAAQSPNDHILSNSNGNCTEVTDESTALLMESKNNFGRISVFFRKNERRGEHRVSSLQEWESEVALTRDTLILAFDSITNSICGNRQNNSILDALWRTKRRAVWG